MCMLCIPILAGVAAGAVVVKAITKPKPKPLPLAVYGEDLED